MFRFIFAVIAVAALFSTAQPVLADPAALTIVDHAQSAAPAAEQPASPARSPSPDAPEAVGSGFGKGVSPVGFGWG
jgi:hypothetical protein